MQSADALRGIANEGVRRSRTLDVERQMRNLRFILRSFLRLHARV